MKPYLFFLFFLFGCAPVVTGTPILRTVHLDPTFSPIETKVIHTGLNEWTIATNNRVQWHYQPYPDYATKTTIAFLPNERHIIIQRAFSTDASVFAVETRIHTRTYGYWFGGDFDYITLVMDRMETTRELRLTIEHEIGHALMGPGHQPHALMEAVGFDVEGITPADLERFCRIWKCQIISQCP